MPLEPAPIPPASGVPGWMWALGVAALALFAWRALGARRQAPPTGAMVTGAPGSPGFTGFAPGVAPTTLIGGSGSGLLGTGLAVAGGVAAGMLAEKLFEGHRAAGLGASTQAGMGGLVPGMFDDALSADTAAHELEQRPIDMGSGDGWGAGEVDASASGDGDGW